MVSPIARAAYAPASAEDERTGLLGFVRVELEGGLVLDGLTLRRSQSGNRYIAWPARGGSGRRAYTVRPVDESSRLLWEQRILAAIAGGKGASHSAGNGSSSQAARLCRASREEDLP